MFLDVLVASKHGRPPGGLQHLGAHNLMIDSTPGWGQSANKLFDESKHDALFIDDDVTLTPYTFDLLERYWDRADIFGFTLCAPENWQAIYSAGFTYKLVNQLWEMGPQPRVMVPSLVPHVTTSCIVVKRKVIDAGLRFPIWPGIHYEDIVYTLEAWLMGFKVAYLPGVCLHHMGKPDENARPTGFTKAQEPDLVVKKKLNEEHLFQWSKERRIERAVNQEVIPAHPHGRPI